MKIKFHLPGFASHYKFNLIFLMMYENCPEFFRDGVEIASFYDSFSQSLWNGGRLKGGINNEKFIQTVIETFNKHGIPLRFTFTNPVLEEKHLSDKFCNMIMKMADNGMNGVIVNSPILEKYIREKYPKFKLTSSTCKRITDPDKLGEELALDYSIVVIDYDLNKKFDILEKIADKEKCELLVNACCTPKCAERLNHYRRIGEHQLAFSEHVRKRPDKPFLAKDYGLEPIINCPHASKNIFEIKELENHISPDEIWEKYAPMGFLQFKIEGRTTDMLNLMETYMYYMIKPEQKDYARFMLMNNLVKNKVITLN